MKKRDSTGAGVLWVGESAIAFRKNSEVGMLVPAVALLVAASPMTKDCRAARKNPLQKKHGGAFCGFMCFLLAFILSL